MNTTTFGWRPVGVPGLLAWLTLVLAWPVSAGAEWKQLGLGDGDDGNESSPVHVIELFSKMSELPDAEPAGIAPGEEGPAHPFNLGATCGRCHDVEAISKGWHFNSAADGVSPGRVGEPWVYVDGGTFTQVPVSGRDWPGVADPAEVGLTPWEMVKRFGHHMPGGDYGMLIDQGEDGLERLDVAGRFEVNCLACHNGSPLQDQSEAAKQIALENFRWVPTASSRLGDVSGSTKGLDPFFDFEFPEMAGTDEKPPAVSYGSHIFNHSNQVCFDIAKKVPARRCYFCHSVKGADDHECGDEHGGGVAESTGGYPHDQDVHLAAGLTCADCHRNETDHMIVRGYEGEGSPESGGSLRASLSCQGCHLGEDESAGRFGAPRPVHRGIPFVHFEKLACTTCHSGSAPQKTPGQVKTARIHNTGAHYPGHYEHESPAVFSPVFAEYCDDKLTVSRLMWPAYWARLKDEALTAIPPAVVAEAAGDVLASGEEGEGEGAGALSDEQIVGALEALGDDAEQGVAVYVSGGKLYQLNGQGQLESSKHEAAGPYTWPLAHNVRPAQQSLGAKGCGDCHTTDAAIFFGEIPVVSAVASAQGETLPMTELAEEDALYWWAFNASFVFRPMLKVVGFSTAGLLLLILLAYGLAGLRHVSRSVAAGARD